MEDYRMASLRTKMGRVFIRKFFNMNPDGGKSFTDVADLISNPGTKVKKGYERIAEATADGVRYDIIKPIGKTSDKLVLYFHGGGYTVGLSQDYYWHACAFAKAAGEDVPCILLDYDLAPRFLYPTQLNQAYSLWLHLVENKGYDPQNIIVGGDSAGGNLTLSLMLKLRDEGRALPCALFLLSPWADMLAAGKSYEANYNVDPMFGEKEAVLNEEKRERLLKSDMYAWCGDADRSDPSVSPVYGDYTGFPPALMTVGKDEILLDDTLTIAQKMQDLGIEVQVISHEKMFHIYPLYYNMFPESKKAFKQILDYISAKMK
jgi:acetyl esterase/lipase